MSPDGINQVMIDEQFDIKELPQIALKKIRAVCKGNGIKKTDIVLKDARGKMIKTVCFNNLDLEPTIEQETKKGRHQVGEFIEDPRQLEKILHDMAGGALKRDETRKFLSDKILSRADKGFGLHGKSLDIEQFNRTFYTLDPCGDCQGVGNTVCGQCSGQRKEVCPQCQTRGNVPCDFCHGSGYIQEGGQQRQCNRCFGQRQVMCPSCQRTGYITCKGCRGSGTRTCRGCQGAAFMTRVAKLAIKLKTSFAIDRAELPPTAIHILEGMGPRMAERKHFLIEAEPVKRDDGGLAIQYKTVFPLGQMQFAIKDKEYKTEIIGFKGKMVKLPDFLEISLRNAFGRLKKAAENASIAQNNIEKLIKRRFFADAILFSSEMSGKKAMQKLIKTYPIGVSKNFVKDSIILSRKALDNASRTARWIAYGAAAGTISALYALYFVGPMRESLNMGNATIAIDLVLLLLGAGISYGLTLILSKQPIKNIIDKIDPARAAKKKIRVPYGPPIVLAVGLFIGIALVAVLSFEKSILWLPL